MFRVRGVLRSFVEIVARDLRYGVRLLAKTPAFSVLAILVLALGIGTNAAVFSLINIVCFRPIPGSEQPGQAVRIYKQDASRPDAYRSFSYADYEVLRDQGKLFDHVMAHASIHVGLGDGDTARRTKAALVTGNYFTTLGVRLAAGRSFSLEEERPGSMAAMMVLSHAYWKTLGSPANILGTTIQVNSRPFTVIGIAPAGFTGTLVLAGPAFWMPLGAAALFAPPSSEPFVPGLMVVGRTKPGVTVVTASAGISAVSGALARSPDGARQLLSVAPLSRWNQSSRPADDAGEMLVPFGALAGAALIVLIIASLNVANMQLARNSNRRKEIAMRLALGAGRGRIVAQLTIEALLLALAGGVLGVAASIAALRAVAASFAPLVPDALWVDTWPDWRVALVSLVCCTLSALVFGLAPSLKFSRLDLLPEVKSQEGNGAGSGLRRFGMRNLLVAGQIALSLMLLAASGLFVRGAIAAGAAEPGYSFDGQLLVRLDAAGGGLDEAAGRAAHRQLLEGIRAIPGVASASMASYVAFGNDSYTRRVWRFRAPGIDTGPMAVNNVLSFDVGATYFKTLGLPLVRGREFTLAEEQNSAAPSVGIIDEPLASALFPGRDPVGQFLQFTPDRPGDTTPPVQVVGVVPGVRHRLTDSRPVPHIYFPLGARYRALVNVHVRAAANGKSGVGNLRIALRDTIRRAGTGVAVLGVQSLEEARDSMPMNWIVRAAASTFGAFGLIALFMATIGLYGVEAYLVARRTREIGIRMAIGADTGAVVRMVVKDGAVLLAASMAIGFLLSVGAGQVVASLLVGVRPFDPLVLSVSTLVLSAAVLMACYVPARRATRISPVTALRTE